jgi:hypothetical protein
MKKLFLLLLVAGAAFSSFAQSSNGPGKFSIGADGTIPTGDAHELFNYGIGGSLKYEFPVSKTVFVTLSAGYESLHVKSEFQEPGSKSSFGFIPVKAGIKPYLDGGFFFEGQLGTVFSTEKDGGNSFLYSPGFGYTFNGGFEIGVRYEAWSNNGTIGQVGARLAYRF